MASKPKFALWNVRWQLLHGKSFGSYYFIYDFMTTATNAKREKRFGFFSHSIKNNGTALASHPPSQRHCKATNANGRVKNSLEFARNYFIAFITFFLIVRKWSEAKSSGYQTKLLSCFAVCMPIDGNVCSPRIYECIKHFCVFFFVPLLTDFNLKPCCGRFSHSQYTQNGLNENEESTTK